MIVSIEGILEKSSALAVVIQVQGIGFEVHVPLSVCQHLPALGKSIRLFIYPVYREDKRELYGFLSEGERDFFSLLVEKVSGIGPKIGLNIMSQLSLAEIERAITSKDSSTLSKCHGVGKKSAERIIVELSGKLSGSLQVSPYDGAVPSSSLTSTDAVAALVTLGYKTNEAEKAVKKALEKAEPDVSVEKLIRMALSL